MAVKIALRTLAGTSPFREYLLRLASSTRGDELVLCSGYLQEGAYAYQVSTDAFLAALARSSIQTVALYGDKGSPGVWSGQLRNFALAVRAQIPGTSAFQVSNFNWHAKVALLLSTGTPVAGIIGSSNLTRPAYGLSGPSWNYECDVIIDPNDLLAPEQDMASVIHTILDPDVNQPSEVNRLNELLTEIRSQTWTQIV